MPLVSYTLCDACHRHVKHDSVRCPFCDASITTPPPASNEWRWSGATRATLFAAAIAGCDRPAPAPTPGPAQQAPPAQNTVAPLIADASVAAIALPDAELAPAMLGLAYGAPTLADLNQPPAPTPQIQLTDVDSESPQSTGLERIVGVSLRSQLGAFRGCYERGLRNNPTLAGSIALRFVVDASGRVTETTASGLEADPAVESCIAARVRSLRFPEGRAAETFSTTLRLSATR